MPHPSIIGASGGHFQHALASDFGPAACANATTPANRAAPVPASCSRSLKRLAFQTPATPRRQPFIPAGSPASSCPLCAAPQATDYLTPRSHRCYTAPPPAAFRTAAKMSPHCGRQPQSPRTAGHRAAQSPLASPWRFKRPHFTDYRPRLLELRNRRRDRPA